MRRALVALLVMVALASGADAQFQRGGRFGRGIGAISNPNYDGAWMFCRIRFQNAPDGDGAGWSVDWPRADENLSFRFSELTRTSVSRSPSGEWNHVVIWLTDVDRLAHCPFIMMTEPGGTYFSQEEADSLRDVPAEGRLPVGRRLLERLRLRPLDERAAQGAAIGRRTR